VAYPIDRRTFLRRGARGLGGAAAFGLAGPALLEACSSSKSSSTATTAAAGSATTAASTGSTAAPGTTSAPGSLGALNVVGPWVPDVETGGEYVADSKGFWTQQGFSSVTVIPSGPNAPAQEQMVATGKGLIAITSLDSTAAAIQKGLNIICIGAQYQKNPFCIMSAKSKPLNTPQDMIGKKIGVQSPNDAVWAAFLQANNLKASQVNKVTVGFDPTPLTQGTVDGWFSFITNEPILLKLKGFDTVTFLLADFNYPEGGNAYICTTDALKTSRAKVKAAMIGDILGWKETLTNPAEAATIAVQKGQGLTQQEELLQAYAQAPLIVTADSKASGLFYMTPTFQAANIKTLGLGGTTVTASQLFDMSLLDEIYQDASLKAVPTPVTG
jgi:ABC-type nitrate/sulfonate/bicarbonate transport system substrate-binding protein